MPLDLKSLKRLNLAVILSVTMSAAANETKYVKDYGTRGHMFPIAETSLLQVIYSKLEASEQSGKLEEMQNEFREKVKRKMLRPTPVYGLARAKIARSWSYNPTLIQSTPILDDRGKVIVAAGTIVNPLDTLSWGKPLLFIDGEDKEQVTWAKTVDGEIVLTNGIPIELSQALDRSVYFDQGGLLIEKFKIGALPAIVEQDGKLLKVSEILVH